MRLLYVAKISESELKGDVESKVSFNDSHLIIDSMINHFKQLSDEPLSGLKVILGSYTIHLLEGNSHGLKHLLKGV